MHYSTITKILVAVLATATAGCGWFKMKKSSSNRREAYEDVDKLKDLFDQKNAIGLALSQQNLPEGSFVSIDVLEGALVNPLRPTYCNGDKVTSSFGELSQLLGGIKWGYGLRYFENERLPIVYAGMQNNRGDGGDGGGEADKSNRDDAVASAQAEGASQAALPEIARADLIGRFGDKVVFLSKRYGLFFVDAPASGKATLSCAVLVPGDAKNFYVHENRLYLVVNGATTSQPAAVVRYDLGDKTLVYSGHHVLEGQTVLDSRRFDSALAVLSRINPKPAPVPESPVATEGASTRGLPVAEEPVVNVLTVLNLAKTMDVAFEEIYQPSTKAMDLASLEKADASLIGKAVDETSSFNDFLSASGRYLLVSKKTNKRVVTALREQAHSETYCVKSEPVEESRSYCNAIWETVDNPKFDPNFSCNDMDTFETCVAGNKEKFVRSYSTYKGKTCGVHKYTVNVCRAYESREWTTIHPVTEDRSYTDMIVYRFENGAFYRMGTDDQPIRQEGLALEHKSFQFLGDYLYVATTAGLSDPRWAGSFNDDVVNTRVVAYLIKDGLFTKAGEAKDLGQRMHVSAVLFSGKTLFLQMNKISYPYYPYGGNKGGPLLALDLAKPHAPRLVKEVDTAGYSEQLVALGEHLLGIGQTPDSRAQNISYARSVLYDAKTLDELTELDQETYASDMERSQNGVGADDQVFLLDAPNQRLVMPVAGQGKVPNEVEGFICTPHFYVYQNYLTITSVDGDALVKEAELATNQKIERSLALDTESILSFSDSAVYVAKKAGTVWKLETVKEEFVTEGLYVDQSLPEGQIVAQQVVRNGYNMKKMRFALGTKAEIEANTPAQTVEVPENMIGCLGAPQRVTYHDDQVLVRFVQNISKGDDQVQANIEYRGNLSWQITAGGFLRQEDQVAKALADERRDSCFIVDGLPENATPEEKSAIIGELKKGDVECWNPEDAGGRYGTNRIL